MDKTDLSLILSAVSLIVALGGNLAAAAITSAFAAGLLLGRTTRRGP